MIGPEALKIGFRKNLVMTSGLRSTDITTAGIGSETSWAYILTDSRGR
jgi:hypothetical protein